MKSITIQYKEGNLSNFVFFNDTESSINNSFVHVPKGKVIESVLKFIREKEMDFTDKITFKPLNEAASITDVTTFLEAAIELLSEKKDTITI